MLSVFRVSFEDKWGSVTRVCARKREKGRWRRVGEEIGGEEDGRDGEKRHPDFVEDALVKAKCNNEIEKAKRRVLVSLSSSLLSRCFRLLGGRWLVGGVGEVVTRSRPTARPVATRYLNHFVAVVPTSRHQLLQTDDGGQHESELAHDQSFPSKEGQRSQREWHQGTTDQQRYGEKAAHVLLLLATCREIIERIERIRRG